MAEIPVSEIPLESLLDEIDREEEELRVKRERLNEAEATLKEVEDELEWEKLPNIEERLKRRWERISQAEERIKSLEDRIAKRDLDLDASFRRIAWLEFRTPYPIAEIRLLRRRIISLRGWQTRERRNIEALTRSIASLKGWITREERWIDRQTKLLGEQAYWREEVKSIQADISHEEHRLEEKRSRVKMVQAQITLVSITTSIKAGKKYEKRFQGFYLIDCIRDPETGMFDLKADLTQRELQECILDFHQRWAWIDDEGNPYTPIDTTPPRLTDISSFEPITEAQGAWFLYCSVIEEDKEEETFGNKELIYQPTPEEKEEFRKYAIS